MDQKPFSIIQSIILIVLIISQSFCCTVFFNGPIGENGGKYVAMLILFLVFIFAIFSLVLFLYFKKEKPKDKIYLYIILFLLFLSLGICIFYCCDVFQPLPVINSRTKLFRVIEVAKTVLVGISLLLTIVYIISKHKTKNKVEM